MSSATAATAIGPVLTEGQPMSSATAAGPFHYAVFRDNDGRISVHVLVGSQTETGYNAGGVVVLEMTEQQRNGFVYHLLNPKQLRDPGE